MAIDADVGRRSYDGVLGDITGESEAMVEEFNAAVDVQCDITGEVGAMVEEFNADDVQRDITGGTSNVSLYGATDIRTRGARVAFVVRAVLLMIRCRNAFERSNAGARLAWAAAAALLQYRCPCDVTSRSIHLFARLAAEHANTTTAVVSGGDCEREGQTIDWCAGGVHAAGDDDCAIDASCGNPHGDITGEAEVEEIHAEDVQRDITGEDVATVEE